MYNCLCVIAYTGPRSLLHWHISYVSVGAFKWKISGVSNKHFQPQKNVAVTHVLYENPNVKIWQVCPGTQYKPLQCNLKLLNGIV